MRCSEGVMFRFTPLYLLKGKSAMKFYVYNLRHRNKNIIKLLAFLAVFSVVFILLFRDNNKDAELAVFNPIQNVSTDKEIYSITASLDGSAQLTDFRTFLDVANGLNVKITFFVSENFFNGNVDTIKEIMKYSHEVGYLIEKDTSAMSRTDAMRYLAKLNDNFYKKCGKYPKYIRYVNEKDKAGQLFGVMAAFGQYNIAEGRYGKAEAGLLVDIGRIDGTSSAKLITVVTEAVNAKLTSVSLKDLLYDVDIPADTAGTQGPG